MEAYKSFVNKIGMTRFIITAMLVGLLGLAMVYNIPIPSLLNDSLVRFGMYGIFVLSMVPMIIVGCGLNFAMPIGIIGGLVGGLVSIEMGVEGFLGLLVAIAVGVPISAVIGYAYGLLLNKVKGSEMIIATYVGFSAVSLMCIGWLFLPFHSPLAVWPIGRGLRTTITLTGLYDKVLDRIGFEFLGVYLPMGLILFFGFFCLLMWLFLRSRMGIAMRAVGSNPRFAVSAGINVDKLRIIATVMSTVLAAIGIVVYSQSFGFYQLYRAPLYMAFPAIAAILIGGSSARDAKISHVIIGTLLFQGLLTISLPVANKILPEGNLSEVMRLIVQNGVILYALTKAGGEHNA